MQVDIEEDQFRAESKKLAVHLADPEVEVRMLLNMHAPLLLAYCHVIRLWYWLFSDASAFYNFFLSVEIPYDIDYYRGGR